MENAVILKTGKVVRKSTFISGSLKIDLQGFADQFAIGNSDRIYKHVNKENFNLQDLDGYDKPISAGYYLQSEFLKYIANIITLKKLNEYVLKDSDLIFAENDDQIEVFRLYIKAPYNYFYKLEKFNIDYKKNIPVVDSNQNIIIPIDKEPVIINFNKTTITSKQFYTKRISIANTFNETKEKDSAALLITKTALMINKIESEIFPLFAQNEDLISYTNNQITEWLSDEILINPSLETLAEFYQNITDYYKVAYSNQLKILESSGIEKLYWLAMGLSSQSLSGLPVNEKWKILHYLIKNKLSNNFERIKEEELVINLLYSFNLSNINEIDQFLSFFLYPYETGTEKKTTFYEILYNSMSTSTNMKQGLLGLSNWVLDTQYQPTTTKGQFIKGLYFLWQFSKYCPYNENDSLKNSTISFKTSNQISEFTSQDTEGFLFKYTHYIAYDPISKNSDSSIIYDYKISRPDATPILMPYESSKFGGIYFDNFNFSIEEDKIIAYQSLPVYTKVGNKDDNYYIVSEKDVKYGTYDLFQPVTLLSTDIETKSALSTINGDDIYMNGEKINSFVPVFVLAFIDGDGDSSDAETLIGYTVDVVTTFTGVGNLTKLKHLRWASSGIEAGVALKSLNGLKIIVGGVEFTTGVLGFFANFVECGEEDTFCKEMKTLIVIFQLSCLAVNVGNGLVTLAARRQAARVISSAGGGANDAEIIANVKSKLKALNPSESEITLNEVASKIQEFSGIVNSGIPVFTIITNVKKIIERSKTLVLSLEYSDNVMTTFINYCRNNLKIVDDEIITDLLVIANRKKSGKFINPTELTSQTNYYINEILKRGFPAGFLSKVNYKQFCNAAKNHFIETLIDFDEDFIQFENQFIFYTKGSSVRARHSINDVNINDVPLPTKFADDIDIDICLPDNYYKKFCTTMTNYAKKLKKEGIIDSEEFKDITANLNPDGDMILYSQIFNKLPVGNSTFLDSFRNSCKNFTKFDSDKINFAIVKTKGKFDLKPKLKFDY